MARINSRNESVKIKLKQCWEESKDDRYYAARIAKRDEAIALTKYRKLRDERKLNKN